MRALLAVLLLCGALRAEHPELSYSRQGLRIESRSGNYALNVRGRVQLRLWHPFDGNTVDPEMPDETDFVVRRARLKVAGNVFRPWLKFNLEQDFRGNGILTLCLTIERHRWLHLRSGQFKPEFNRERVTSSGRQQFADRSIINSAFTVDRQTGVMINGRLLAGERGDSRYAFGVFTGTGRGNWVEEGSDPMVIGRYQWNLLRKDLDFSSSAIEYYEQPAVSLAVAGAISRGRYTEFSSDGGGQLDGFEPGQPGQYSLKQGLGEAMVKFKGFSFQNEYHWKNVFDHINSTSTDMTGSYAQTGYFPHYKIDFIPQPLEIGYRYAWLDPHTEQPNDLHQEHSLVANWFFEGHDNKLTFEAARLSVKLPGGSGISAWRYRVQWDVHF